MTNPDNIVRVRARNGGRASVYEANGWAQAYSMGLLEGNGVTQNTSADMNVLVGGSTTKPDVVIAENPAGYKIALDLVTQQAVAITAPASNSRISAIVAYTDDLSLQSTETDITGSPASCGLIVVNGTTAATPAVPDDSQIRSAITADGATGSQASYCIIATVEVAAGTTIITDSQITNRVAKLSSSNVDLTTFLNNPKFIQTGSKAVWAYHSNSTGGLETITFDTPFENTPIVLATPSVFNVYGVALSTYEVTKTGFKISARHTHDSGDAISVSAKWVAIDVAKLCLKPNN